MAWFSRFTRFGDLHWVYGQENTVACGVACAIMCVFKINKIKPGAKAVYDEKAVLKLATELFGPRPLGSAGLNNPQMVRLLNHPKLGIGGWRLRTLKAEDVPETIMDEVGVTGGIGPTVNVRPMVVGVDWNGGGGHWAVVDTVRSLMGKTYATLCDPWDANVHMVPMEKQRAFAYTGKKVQGFDFWGKRHEYKAPSEGGVFVGDVIIRG